MKTPPSLSPGFSRAVPEGDDRLRQVCDHCGFIAYENPKLVVGSVVRHEGRFLLCRRRHAWQRLRRSHGAGDPQKGDADGAKRPKSLQ